MLQVRVVATWFTSNVTERPELGLTLTVSATTRCDAVSVSEGDRTSTAASVPAAGAIPIAAPYATVRSNVLGIDETCAAMTTTAGPAAPARPGSPFGPW